MDKKETFWVHCCCCGREKKERNKIVIHSKVPKLGHGKNYVVADQQPIVRSWCKEGSKEGLRYGCCCGWTNNSCKNDVECTTVSSTYLSLSSATQLRCSPVNTYVCVCAGELSRKLLPHCKEDASNRFPTAWCLHRCVGSASFVFCKTSIVAYSYYQELMRHVDSKTLYVLRTDHLLEDLNHLEHTLLSVSSDGRCVGGMEENSQQLVACLCIG